MQKTNSTSTAELNQHVLFTITDKKNG